MQYSEVLSRFIEKSGKTLDQISEDCTRQGVTVHPTYISKLRLGKRSAPSDEVSKVLALSTGGDYFELKMAADFERSPEDTKEMLLEMREEKIKRMKRVKEEREKLGLSYREVADKVGLTDAEVEAFENTFASQPSVIVKKIAELFEVDFGYITGMDDERKSTRFDWDIEKEKQHKEQTEFDAFINDPENNLFFKELLDAPEERIKELRQIWEIIKRASETEEK